jgi:predicted amidophosphoribosyltransferase
MATAKKKNPKRVCPNCGRKMAQQFIGLKHCKCGVSWKKDEGYFERAPGMVFALQRQVVKKGKNSARTKQVPVIRYADNGQAVPFIDEETETNLNIQE